MSFFKWLSGKKNTKDKREINGIKRIYNRGYRDGWTAASKESQSRSFKEGQDEGWKEAMSTIGNIVDKMISRPDDK